MKTTSAHNQSTSQTPSHDEPTQTLPDPGRTQRIVWTPPNTPPRLSVTPGGGPRPDPRTRRDFLNSVAGVVLFLLLVWSLPISRTSPKPPVITVPPQPLPVIKFDPLPPPIFYNHTVSGTMHVYLHAPSVPIPAEDSPF